MWTKFRRVKMKSEEIHFIFPLHLQGTRKRNRSDHVQNQRLRNGTTDNYSAIFHSSWETKSFRRSTNRSRRPKHIPKIDDAVHAFIAHLSSTREKSSLKNNTLRPSHNPIVCSVVCIMHNAQCSRRERSLSWIGWMRRACNLLIIVESHLLIHEKLDFSFATIILASTLLRFDLIKMEWNSLWEMPLDKSSLNNVNASSLHLLRIIGIHLHAILSCSFFCR